VSVVQIMALLKGSASRGTHTVAIYSSTIVDVGVGVTEVNMSKNLWRKWKYL